MNLFFPFSSIESIQDSSSDVFDIPFYNESTNSPGGQSGVSNDRQISSRILNRVDPSLIIDDDRRYPFRHRITDNANLVEIDNIEIPRSYRDAIESPQSKQWLDAMNNEMNSFCQNQVFDEIPEQDCLKKPLHSRWIFTVKKDSSNRIEKFKARIVIRGDHQQEDIDYKEIFSPVVNMTTLRTALTISACRNYSLSHIDVKTAYLHAELDELIYVKPPPGFAKDNKFWKLRKSVYGLKQSARNWFFHLSNLLKNDFIQSKNDSCLYRHKNFDLFMLVYVDDFLIGYKSHEDYKIVYDMLSASLSIRDLGQPTKFCGFEIHKYHGYYHLSQRSFLKQLAEEFGISNLAKYPKVPLQTFILDDKSPVFEDGSLCRRLIGSLQYMTRTRPDITASINSLSVKMQMPTHQIWNGAKKVLAYLVGTSDIDLILGKFSDNPLEVFTDADHANHSSRKSISGVLIKVFGSSVFWSSSRQKCVSISTAESEFYALSMGLSEGLWLQRILHDFGVNPMVIPLYVDNKSAICIAENGPMGESKHIDTRAHFVKDYIEKKFCKIFYLQSDLMVADFLTKPFNSKTFQFVKSTVFGSRGGDTTSMKSNVECDP